MYDESCYYIFQQTMANNTVKKEQEKETFLTYTSQDFFYTTTSEHGEDLASHLDILLPRKWLASKADGAFIYSVDDVETKILPGKYGIVTQVCFRNFSEVLDSTNDL